MRWSTSPNLDQCSWVVTWIQLWWAEVIVHISNWWHRYKRRLLIVTFDSLMKRLSTSPLTWTDHEFIRIKFDISLPLTWVKRNYIMVFILLKTWIGIIQWTYERNHENYKGYEQSFISHRETALSFAKKALPTAMKAADTTLNICQKLLLMPGWQPDNVTVKANSTPHHQLTNTIPTHMWAEIPRHKHLKLPLR